MKNNNSWTPTNEAQKQWCKQWKAEQEACNNCNLNGKCTILDRRDITTCKSYQVRKEYSYK